MYRRKDGRVVGEWTDALGRRRYVSGKDKPEVKSKLRKRLAEVEEGVAYDDGGLTLGDYRQHPGGGAAGLRGRPG